MEAKDAEAAFLEDADLRRWSADLHPTAKRFIGTAETVAQTLTSDPQLDWSPAVIGLCKAFELELIVRLVEPLREMMANEDLTKDCLDKDLGRVARYCAGRQSAPPEIGAVGHFISTAMNSAERASTSALIQQFRRFVNDSPSREWLGAKDGLQSCCSIVTSQFRNPAAHIDEVDGGAFTRCRDFLIGGGGSLWKLLRATQ